MEQRSIVMRTKRIFNSYKNLNKKIRHLYHGAMAVGFALAAVAVGLSHPDIARAAYAYPSTHANNVTNGWAHAEVLDDSVPGKITMRFYGGTQISANHISCFEYRTDGDIGQALASPNPNPAVEDRYPAFCVNGHSSTDKQFLGNDYVEIRSTFGAEADERFDWTLFDILAPPPQVPTATFTEDPSGEVVPDGGLTDSQHFIFSLNSAGTVTRYQLKYWNDIVGSPFKVGTPWNPTDLAGYSSGLGVYHDNFTQGPGIHYFSFSACNGDLCSDYSTPFTVTFDNVAPTTPQIEKPLNEQAFTSSPILNDWTDSTDANGINKYQIEYIYDDGHSFSGGPYRETAGNQSKRNHSPATFEQGGVTIRVRAFDNAGNASDWSDPVHYYYDKTKPTIEILEPTVDSSIFNSLVQVKATDNVKLKQVTGHIYTSANQLIKSCTKNVLALNVDEFTLSCDTSGLADGDYYVKANARDVSDTLSTTLVRNFTIDRHAPLAEITSHNDGDFVNGLVKLVGEVTDDNPMNSYFRIEGPNGYVKTSLLTNGVLVHELDWDTVGLEDGEYTIYFETRDQANNKDGSRANPGPSVAKITVTVDNTAPVVTLDSIDDTSDTVLTLSGTINDPDATVLVSINGDTPKEAQNTGGTWSFITPSLSIGSYNVVVSAVDQAGNQADPEPTDDFNIVLSGNGGGGQDGGGGPTLFFQPLAATAADGGAGAAGAGPAGPDGAGGGDGGGDGDQVAQGVEGETEDTDEQAGEVNADNVKVSAATTEKVGSALSWWWLLILLALAGAFYAWYRRRKAQQE